jgi:hypothetical protein
MVIGELDVGEWNIEDWYGGVLRTSDIININNESEQKDEVLGFFSKGLESVYKYFSIFKPTNIEK